MATYDELARYVSDWANRDESVLEFKTIKQCIQYAHDETYRTLRIASLETTGSGVITAKDAANGFLTINEDLVEFIQLRKLRDNPEIWDPRAAYKEGDKVYYDVSFWVARQDIAAPANDMAADNDPPEDDSADWRAVPISEDTYPDDWTVAEAKADLRSFRGDHVTLYSNYAYTRENDKLYILPRIKEGEVWYLNYYRRLPEASERFTDDELIALGDTSPGDDSRWLDLGTIDPNEDLDINSIHRDLFVSDPALEARLGSEIEMNTLLTGFDDSRYYITELKSNWLRDVNEKVLLFGALNQAFDYLDEMDQAGKYKGKFEQEIAKLNKEEMDRMNSGGNIQINFYNALI